MSSRKELSERELEPIHGSVIDPWGQEIFRNSQRFSHLQMGSTFTNLPSSDLDEPPVSCHVRTLQHSAQLHPHCHGSPSSESQQENWRKLFSCSFNQELFLWIQSSPGLYHTSHPSVTANSFLNDISLLEMCEPSSWAHWRDKLGKLSLPASFLFSLCWGL